MNNKKEVDFRCPCHSGATYRECCKRYHDGVLPETALQLMRSRFSAYAMKLPEYIIDTTHPENPAYRNDRAKWKKEIESFSESTVFEGLEILDFVPGEIKAIVTFTAVLHQEDRDATFTEKSFFEKVDGRWLYHTGVMEPLKEN